MFFIEQCIIENIYEYQNQDLYSLLLFKKSAALYNTSQVKASSAVLQELIKMDPSNDMYQRLLKRCFKISNNFNQTKQKGSIVLLFLLFIALSGVQLFVIDTFFRQSSHTFSVVKNSTLFVAISIWLGVELYQEWSYRKVLRRILKEKKQSPEN